MGLRLMIYLPHRNLQSTWILGEDNIAGAANLPNSIFIRRPEIALGDDVPQLPYASLYPAKLPGIFNMYMNRYHLHDSTLSPAES